MSGERVEERGGRRQQEQQHSSAISATKQRGGTSDTHARQQGSRIVILPHFLWITLFSLLCSWRFCLSWCCIILSPDETQEYSQSVEEQRSGDAVHKVRSPESSTAFAPDANRAHSSSALQHSKLSSWCSPPLTQAASSAAITPKGEGAFLEGEQVDVEGGWRAGAGRGGRGGRAS